jgi:hypothetical protein
VREVGYRGVHSVDPADVVKFGKRVDFQNKLTHEEVMEEHLKQIRQKMEMTKLNGEMKKKQERDFLEQVKRLEELEY